jgi:hypothetical protein
MGYGWDEVHDEAEQLEHVVSDRLINRMDEMLGRPEVDPHGDPIPDAHGIVKQQDAQSLLTCPLNTRVTVTRVIDQDKTFLRFLESHHLKPGESIEVEDRDAASDSVRVRGKDDQRITIGTRAASKLLVHVGRALLLLALAAPAAAQSAAPFEILDNSFLVEEAFNQEPGIFQNIFNVHRAEGGDWQATFTQEWPVITQAHQLSYTVAYGGIAGMSGLGDLFVNYRWQAWTEGDGRPAFSPRVSIILPTGRAADGFGNGNVSWQVNFPFSKQFGDLYLHWNAGLTHAPATLVGGVEHNLHALHAAASGIWRVRPMLNLMIESVVAWDEVVTAGGAHAREAEFTLSPGLRTGFDIGDTQTILGVAVPVVFTDAGTSAGVFAYLSYELPFRR